MVTTLQHGAPEPAPERPLSCGRRCELETAAHEPLLPVEKRLIGWSLGTGLVLLVVLAIVNQFILPTF